MQIDPIAERQRISDVYRRMYDDELLNLVADSEDLTEIARGVLEEELKRRGLGDLLNAVPAQNAPEPKLERRAALLGNQGGAPQIVLDYRSTLGEAPLEYTWKTLLCECESMHQAQQVSEFLRLSGIDSWIDDPDASSRFKGLEIPRPRVSVAADQLDQARAIMANPIPKEIVEDSRITVTEFETPPAP